MKEKNSQQGAEVSTILDQLNHPLRAEIDQLRKIILNAHDALKENWKWNSPNYHIDNNDRITMKIYPQQQIQLIFHCGAKKTPPASVRMVRDERGILKWISNDRALIAFKNSSEINNLQVDLEQIAKNWLEATLDL